MKDPLHNAHIANVLHTQIVHLRAILELFAYVLEEPVAIPLGEPGAIPLGVPGERHWC